jgi:hypothetical protein
MFLDSAVDIPTDTIRGIRVPAIVIIGDADVVRPEHALRNMHWRSSDCYRMRALL